MPQYLGKNIEALSSIIFELSELRERSSDYDCAEVTEARIRLAQLLASLRSSCNNRSVENFLDPNFLYRSARTRAERQQIFINSLPLIISILKKFEEEVFYRKEA